MLIWDCPSVINDWVSKKGGGKAWPGSYTALGWMDRDSKLLTAGVVFYDCNGVNCSVNLAISNGVFSISLLKAALFYAFSQLKLRRLTFIIAEGNIRSQNLVRSLGAIPEATLRDAGIEGNMVIFALFPENCEIWSRIDGKRRRIAAGRT